MENLIEKILFASRWLMAPLYLGLAALPSYLRGHRHHADVARSHRGQREALTDQPAAPRRPSSR
jgi:hypothetical protein